ncbi:Uncharacterised protein r2_g3283 [Pycnogonum litorale]
MINSFLNLCRACPMPLDGKRKFNHSEYKQNYKWYESYSTPTVDQPASNQKSSDLKAVVTSELAIPRRKKHPEVAYKSHHVMYQIDPAVVADRARSKEKSMANSRSRSADPNLGRKSVVVNPISEYEVPYQRNNDPLMTQSFPPCAPSSSNHPHHHRSSKFSTEYGSQYAWPKSVSLNAIKGNADKNQKIQDVIDHQPVSIRHGKITEYTAKFRPFSAYEYVDGIFKEPVTTSVVLTQPTNEDTSWYQEVVETRKKAEEYKSRSRYSTLESDHFEEIYKRQVDLWSHISSRYMLSALSLASASPVPKKKKLKKEGRPQTAPAHGKRASQSPQKSPQKKVGDDARSCDSTSPVKSDMTRPRSPKKPFGRPSTSSVPGSAKPVAVAKPQSTTSNLSNVAAKPKKLEERSKSNEAKQSNRPTTLTSTPRPKPSSRVELPKAHSKPKSTSVVNPPVAGGKPGKIWLKPTVAKEKESDTEEKQENPQVDENYPVDVNKSGDEQKPLEDNSDDKRNVLNGADSLRVDSPPPLPEPVHLTHVRSPEEVTGVKSPDPETWTVPLHKSQPLQWTDGQTGSPMSDKTSTPGSQKSPQHAVYQKPKVSSATATPPQQHTPKHHASNVIDENCTDASENVCPTKNMSPKTTSTTNPDEVLDKARSRLDEFWND